MSDLTRRAWIGLAQLGVVLLVGLFLPAWTLRYWQAWAFLALFMGSAAAITWYLQRHDLALLQRRLAAGPRAEKERRQQVIQGVASLSRNARGARIRSPFRALGCFTVMVAVIVWRLVEEERFLARDLPGYDAYRDRVRYRRVPFLW